MYERFGKAEGIEQTVAVSSSRNRRWRHAGNNFTGKHNETKKISSRTRLLLRSVAEIVNSFFFSKDVFSMVPNQNYLAPRCIVQSASIIIIRYLINCNFFKNLFTVF